MKKSQLSHSASKIRPPSPSAETHARQYLDRSARARSSGRARSTALRNHGRRFSWIPKFTREGKFFVGITFGVGLAAINTGNNLLYLLLGMLLGLIVVSGFMSELSLRHLTVVRRLPLRAQVGRPHLVEIEVFNHKGRVPSYAIEVEDLRAGQPADKRCFFLKISPKSAQVAAYRRTPSRRGRDRHVGFRIATRFPFGLFEKSREIPSDGELIIYPAVDPVQLPPLPPGRHVGGDVSLGRGHGDDYIGLKLHRQGEDAHDVHWRKSASVGQLVMRERAREAQPDIVLSLDVIRPDEVTEEWRSAFERRIRDLASRAVAHLKRGDSVTIRTNSQEAARGNRSTGADRLLRFLALIEAVTTAELSARLPKLPSTSFPDLARPVEASATTTPETVATSASTELPK
jgi:uncharacterized protein (DUF58 family)